MNYQLKFSRDYRNIGDTYVIGNAYHITDNQMDVGKKIDSCNRLIEIKSVLESITGHYAIVTTSQEGLLLISDQINSIPIYYNKNKHLCVSDDQETIIDNTEDPNVSRKSKYEYLSSSYTTGDKTLLCEVSKTSPGVIINMNDFNSIRWFDWNSNSNNSVNYNTLRDLTMRIIDRLVKYADGREIVVPITGGSDSKYILTSIINKGYSNVTAISYGKKEITDVCVGERIANSLSVDWKFCEYTPERWYNWYRTEDRKLIDKKLSLFSVPSLREWGAIRYLKRESQISKDCVIVPGHSGMVCGGRIHGSVRNYNFDLNLLIESIFNNHYEFYDLSEYEKMRVLEEICKVCNGPKECSSLDMYEKFDYRARQSNRIIHQVRSHDVMGYDWWLPMLDVEFINYWKGISVKERMNKNSFKKFVHSYYTDMAGDDAINPQFGIRTKLDRYKSKIPHLPYIGSSIENVYTAVSSSKTAAEAYNSDKMARLGVYNLEEFKNRYNGNTNLRAYRAQDIIKSYEDRFV